MIPAAGDAVIDVMIDETADIADRPAAGILHATAHVADLVTTTLVRGLVDVLTIAPRLVKGVIQLVLVTAASRAGPTHVSTVVPASVAPPGRVRRPKWMWLIAHHRI
jgi:hypothetical protein